MAAITQKLQEEMAPALYIYGRDEMPSTAMVGRAGDIIHSLTVLSGEEARRMESLFHGLWEQSHAKGYSAAIGTLLSNLQAVCKGVALEAEAAERRGAGDGN